MLNRIFTLAIFLLPFLASAQNSTTNNLNWHNAREFTTEGKGWTDTTEFYDRLPTRAKQMVRPPVWGLSEDSAGICVRFITDATKISARWSLRKPALGLANMSQSGVSGLDLYVKEQGKWHWVGAGRPEHFPTNEAVLVNSLQPGKREFCLYLPLYNGVTNVELGVSAKTEIIPASVRSQKPIVFYGTSILQGGCASRPGMAYPAIIGRHLDWPTINLGFSGNARSEPELAQLLAELDPVAYILDPLPNMSDDMVKERIEPFIKTLRQAHPETPIILVENIQYTDAPYIQSHHDRYTKSNAALKNIYNNLRKAGFKKLSYVTTENLLGNDNEATVDGTHPTDLGFVRMVEKIEPVLKKWVK